MKVKMRKTIFKKFLFIFLFFNIFILVSCDNIKTLDDETDTMIQDVDINTIETMNILISDNMIKKYSMNNDYIKSYQGSAAFNNYIVRLGVGGEAFLFKENDLISYFHLGSYSQTSQHANCCNFSSIYINNNSFPLLYVSGGNSTESFECDVELLSIDNNDISSECIQKIFLDQSDFSFYEYSLYWGWPCWIIDNDALYCFGALYRTNGAMKEYDSINKYIITKFEIPDLNNPIINLSAKDVKKQYIYSYDMCYTQGGTIYKNFLLFAFGAGTIEAPSGIKIFPLDSGKVINLFFDNTILNNIEFEDLFIMNDRMFISCNNKDVYYIDININDLVLGKNYE